MEDGEFGPDGAGLKAIAAGGFFSLMVDESGQVRVVRLVWPDFSTKRSVLPAHPAAALWIPQVVLPAKLPVPSKWLDVMLAFMAANLSTVCAGPGWISGPVLITSTFQAKIVRFAVMNLEYQP